jgi:hypothetical protein
VLPGLPGAARDPLSLLITCTADMLAADLSQVLLESTDLGCSTQLRQELDAVGAAATGHLLGQVC